MFTIDTDNNIAVHATTPASTDNLQLFASEKELGVSLPGLTRDILLPDGQEAAADKPRF